MLAAGSGGYSALKLARTLPSTGSRTWISCGHLLLDEPFEGVAPALARGLSEVIGALRDVGVLLAQSDLNHSVSLLDREYLLERGANARSARAARSSSGLAAVLGKLPYTARVVSGIIYVICYGLQWKDAPPATDRIRRSIIASCAEAALACSSASSRLWRRNPACRSS